MSIELEFSVISTSKNQLSLLEHYLADFEQQTNVKVRLNVLQWATARAELVKYGLYRHGADVSEAGSTWVSDFIGMNVLRCFEPREVEIFGGEESFVPAAWRSGATIGEEKEVWAIPWMVSPVLIAYRADWLDRAGVDAETGFASFDALERTVERLASAGHPLPLALPVHNSRYGTLHNIASWIWGAGSDFFSESGRKVVFDQPQSLAGIVRYYDLRRFFLSSLQLKEDGQKQLRCGLEFWKGNAAIAISGSWLLSSSLMTDEVQTNVRVAPLPAPAFVGAQSLVVWKHSRNPGAALDLVNYLMQPNVLAEYTEELGLMPARKEIVGVDTMRDAKVLAQIVLGGRAFPAARLLGLVEDKLSLTLENLWDEIFELGAQDAGSLIQKRLEGLARQLNMTLST